MMMIHDNKPFITTPSDVMNHHHHHPHHRHQQQQQQDEEDRSFPSFVKQIFTSLSCLQPTNASQGGVVKKEQDEADKHAARMYLATAADSFPDSLFLKMYFSFPALEEFDGCNGGSTTSSTSHSKKNTKKNSPSSAAVEQCKRLLR